MNFQFTRIKLVVNNWAMFRPVTARQQANAAAKRMRGGSSSDEFVRGSEDELEGDSDGERRPPGSDSELSDFNPFHGGSDSDDGQ